MECTTAEEQDFLVAMTQQLDLTAVLLPVCSVGVQVLLVGVDGAWFLELRVLWKTCAH